MQMSDEKRAAARLIEMHALELAKIAHEAELEALVYLLSMTAMEAARMYGRKPSPNNRH